MADSARMTTSTARGESPGRVHAARLLQVATTLQQRGKLHEAEQLYRSILDIEPGHFGSLFGLGTVHTQAGKLDDAVSMFQQASGAAGNSADIQSRLGDLLAMLGRPAEAIACYHRALAVNPRHAGAHNNLGVALQRLGRLEEAVVHYEQAVAIRPDLVEARGSLGNALRALGRPHEAMEQYRQALAISPGHAEARNNLAGVLLMLGRPAEAIAHYHQAIAARPDYAEAHFNLGNACSEIDRHEEAVGHYEKAIAIRPDFAAAHNNLANAMQKLGRSDDAIVHYRRALAITPDYADAHRNLGNVLLALDRNEEAIAHYERTLAVDPAQAEVHNNMGAAHHVLGRSEEACRAYERAVELAPRRGAMHLNLASLKPFAVGDGRLVALESLAADMTTLLAEDRIALHFALGKAYGDLDLPDRSFHHLSEGNALKRQEVIYDEVATLRSFARIRQVFTDELMRRKGGDPSTVPVFVLGMPRSGTTLVEQILASHSRMFGAGEREDFRQAALSLKGADGEAYPAAVPSMSGPQLRQLGSRYVEQIRAAAPAAERIVDKMPMNFAFIGLIHLALPNARIIHVRRDPIDTCFSTFSLLFTGDQPHAYDLGELGRYYRAYEALMEHWRSVLPPGVMLDVRYEDVVDDLEGQARRMVEHCGLEWEDACLAFHATKRTVHTASATQVRQPIYRSSVGRWRPYGHLLQPLLHALDRPQDAVACGRLGPAVALDDAEAHVRRGNDLHLLGRCADAVVHYAKALAINPDHAEAHNNLASALHALGRREDAVSHFRRALAINPALPQAHRNLGLVLVALDRPEQAMAHFEQAVALEPGDAEAHRNLGDMLVTLKRHAEAIAHYETARAIRPDDPKVLDNLACALQKLGRFDEAVALCERAVTIEPDFAAAHSNLGNAMMALRRNEAAIAHYSKSLAVDPSRDEAQNNIGVALQALGRLDEAERAFERAVALAPRKASIHLNLAHARPFTVGDERLVALQSLADDDAAALGEEETIALHFALGKAFADLKQPEQSFHHLLTANALQRRRIGYDETEALGLLTRTAEVFTADLLREHRGCGDPSPAPVFVVGMPRSGTTLVEQILASHSRVFGAGERDDLGRVVTDLARSKDASRGILDLLPSLSGAELRRIGTAYLDRIRVVAAAPAKRVVDKMPSNFLLAGLIHLALPNARIIHACRHPADTCLSCFSLLFAGDHPYTYDLGELGRYHRAYAALMAHWRDVLPAGVMIDVHYEDVVADLEGQARRIVAHCGLAWEDACLAFHRTQRPVHTASATQVRRPIYRGSVGRWRAYEHLLSPLLGALEPGIAGSGAPTC